MRKIQILGAGCPKCERLEARVREVADELGIAYELQKIPDMLRILELGVMALPALVVDGDVKAMGRVPSVEEVKSMIA